MSARELGMACICTDVEPGLWCFESTKMIRSEWIINSQKPRRQMEHISSCTYTCQGHRLNGRELCNEGGSEQKYKEQGCLRARGLRRWEGREQHHADQGPSTPVGAVQTRRVRVDQKDSWLTEAEFQVWKGCQGRLLPFHSFSVGTPDSSCKTWPSALLA